MKVTSSGNALDALGLTREDMVELVKKREARIAELEAGISAVVTKATYNGMGDWQVFRGLRKLIHPTPKKGRT